MTEVRRVEPKSMTLLPPAPDACQTCATKHPPDYPHNPESLYWQTARHMAGEDPPTWDEALEHCPPHIQERWAAELARHGVTVNLNDRQEKA